jgi:hypothetical protein
MLELQLRHQLANVARRIGTLWMWQRLTWAWIVLTALVACWAFAGRPMIATSGWLAISAAVVAFVWIRSRLLKTSRTDVARQIEQAFPDLNSRLLAALEQHPDIETGRFNVLQRQVIAEAVHHARMNDWTDAVSQRQMRHAILRQSIALTSFALIGLLAIQATSKSAVALSGNHAGVAAAVNERPVIVEPGNAELERGSSLLVLARFTGQPPADVHVIWKGADEIEHRLSLSKSLDDPVFATRIPVVKDDIAYRIDFDGQQTTDYQIDVYDLPALVRADLNLQYPSYTNLDEKTLQDAREATVVEGTRISLACHVNKSLASATLIDADGTSFALVADLVHPDLYGFSFQPTKRLRLKLHLVDAQGRQNRDPEEFRLDVVPNRTPEVKLAFPGKDVKASPLEEILIEATTIDDFGILEAGLVVQLPGREPVTLPLGQGLKGGEQHKLSSIQRLEELRVQPDELVTYFLYAIDIGPDGERRQTDSDMYFAEIRPFDEIFRQVDQEGAGEMQPGQKPPESLGKLLELQKQIIIATWNVTRSFKPEWSPANAEKIATIQESQQQATQKLKSLREKMTQPQLQPVFSTIATEMDKAEHELGRSLDEKSYQPLRPAAVAEQSAYQGLLKLRTKEHLLMQAKSKGNGQANEEKERHDLELKRKQNRYESEKGAAKNDESNVNREALAILDRLKELARRQEGINEQLKELEAQMRQAKTDSEREEIERQLKRLREEQQQLLHDADELRNKLNKSAQQELVAETKQQLEQTRQRMVDTAEKLREGQVSQALNAGTRAERELKQLHEDFRKQTAAQFGDAMRSLRDEARQLADREQQLADQLTQLGDESRRTLRQSHERTTLQAEFQEQQKQANEIVEQARQVVQQAEASEPLLSRQLYDTLRSTRESKLEQALDATQQLLKGGFVPEATKAEQQARQGIEHLKQGIEKAAESVLGNEVDSLKRARRELAELSQQLEQEIRAQSKGSEQGKTGDGAGNKPGEPGQKPAPGTRPGQFPAKDGKGATPGDSAGTRDGEGQGKPSDEGAGSEGGKSSPNDSRTPGESSSSPAEGSPGGVGQGKGEAPGQPGAAGDSSGPGGSSDASAPTATNPAASDNPSERRGPAGLRRPKNGGTSKPAPGSKDVGQESNNNGGSPGNGQGGGPLTGGNYAEFNERLRDVESMISDPQLQADVQKVRDRARSARAEFKRHTQTPDWDLVRSSVQQPMIELQQRLSEEISKRESPDSLVPVDRDPVPTRYRDLVRSYYERLGTGKGE